MMGFMMLTLSFTIVILLAGVISTVVLIKLMGNKKFVKWLMGFYMKQIENMCNNFDEDLKEVGV